MEELGIIKTIKKDKAVVQFDRKSACEKCNMCLSSKDKMKVELTLENKLNAKVGDSVKVQMGDGFVLVASFIVYIIPLILICIGIFAFKNFVEYIQIIASLTMLIAGFVIAIVLDKFVISKKKGFRPRMVEITNKVIAAANECEADEELRQEKIEENLELTKIEKI